MKFINLNSNDLSLFFWNKVLENSAFSKIYYYKDFIKKIDKLEILRKHSAYNTGSVSSTTAWLLYSAVKYFKPKLVVEIGSFIGKSTFSMAYACDDFSDEFKSKIYCCDHSNEIEFPKSTKTQIIQFHKKNSTEMLKTLDEKEKIELLHLDGRLLDEDFAILKKLVSNGTIYFLDDFEGNQKGVINYNRLLASKIIEKSHFLIYPVKKETKKKFNLLENSTTACLLPISRLKVTPQ